MREQWKRAGDFVRAPTRIINHRSNAHFGRWTRQMWFKINIKNPFPLRKRVPPHILSAAEVMAPGVHACTRERQKANLQASEKTLAKWFPILHVIAILSFDVMTESLKDKWLLPFFTDINITFNHPQSPQDVLMAIINS